VPDRPENPPLRDAAVEGPAPEPETFDKAPGDLPQGGPDAPDFYLDARASVTELLRVHDRTADLSEDGALRLVHFQVPPEFQLLFKKPFRVKVKPPGEDAERESYLVILSLDETGAVVVNESGGTRSLDRDFMLAHWSGDVSWFSPEGDGSTLYSVGVTSPGVAEIQRNLMDLGYGSEINGYYGSKTADAVRRFQLDMGLKADGLAGARTLALLDIMAKPGGGEPR
jgi:hypothetical protein